MPRFSLILTKTLFSIECKYSSSYGHFLPTTFEIVFYLFVEVTPPPPPKKKKKKNAKMRNFCNGFWKMMMSTFKKNHSILNLRVFFHIEKYGCFTQHAAVAILRHSATMGLIKHTFSCHSLSAWPQVLSTIRGICLSIYNRICCNQCGSLSVQKRVTGSG